MTSAYIEYTKADLLDEIERLRKLGKETDAYLATIDELVVSRTDPEWNPRYPATPFTLDCDPKGVLERVRKFVETVPSELRIAQLERVREAATQFIEMVDRVNERPRREGVEMRAVAAQGALRAALEL